MQKDWLEDLVVRETMKLIQDEAVIDKIVQLVMDVQNQENTTIPLLEKQLREVNKKLDNLMKAIEDGLYTRTTKERLEALESQKDELTVKIADEKLKKPSFNEDFIRFWLMKFRKFDISQKKQRKALIEIFVNAIFLYDDRMLITFNYKDGTQTVRFEDTLTADCGEKSLRLRSNESPSGAFEQQNGLAQARWRGLAPTSSDLSSSAGTGSCGIAWNTKSITSIRSIRCCLNTIRNSWVRDLSPTRHPSAQSGKRKSRPTSRSGIRGKGGDSDTLACITGGVAEAFYGIPQELQQETLKRLPEEMRAEYALFRQNLERRM